MAQFNTVVAAFQHWARCKPLQPALVFRDKHHERHVLTWQRLYTLSGRYAAVLRKEGLSRGCLVVSTLPNSPERAVCDLAIWMSGAATVNGQCQLPDGSDLLHTLRLSRANAILVDPDVTDSPWRVLKNHVTLDDEGNVRTSSSTTSPSSSIPYLKKVFFIRRVQTGGSEDFLQGLEAQMEWFQSQEITTNDLFTVFTTSGSTGFSKLVPQMQGKFILPLRDSMCFANVFQQPVVFNNSPLGWGLGSLGYTLVPGNTRVLCDIRAGIPDDMAHFLWRTLEEEKCDTAFFSPVHLPRLAQLVSAQELSESGQPTPWKVKTILLGGLPVTRTMVETALQIADAACVVYGSTDTGLVSDLMVTDAASYTDYDSGNVAHCAEVKIVVNDDEDCPLPSNKTGSILLKTPWTMNGYLNDEQATSRAFTRSGFLRLGDYGRLDERGHLIVQGRGSDAIMRGPYIFYPDWMESRLRAGPGVRDVLVVGVPDPFLHEELCACVILESDHVTLEHVQKFVETDMIPSENDPLSPRPRHYLRFESFPQTTTFKPKRKEVKVMAAKRLNLLQGTE